MSLELNKIAAAVLTGGVIAMGSGFVAKLLVHEEHLEQSVYLPAGMDAPAEQTAEAEPALEPVLPLLASASVDSGETITRKCSACHAFEKGGANKVGPALWGVVGAQIASHEGYSYSEALQNAPDEVWTYSALNAFMANPAEYAPGTKMSYAGLSSVQDRADLIAYLRTLSDDPQPLPTEEEISAVTASAEAAMDAAGEAAEGMAEAAGDMVEAATGMAEEAAGGGILAKIASADPAVGEKSVRKCAACHSFDEGGPNKVGPNLWGVVGAKIAGHEGYSYSSALSEKEGTWDYQTLAAFLTNPKEWAPGTKMSYAGVKDEDELAALIAYLRTLSNDPEPLPDNAALAPKNDSKPAADAEEAQEQAATPSEEPGPQAALTDQEKAQRAMESALALKRQMNHLHRLAKVQTNWLDNEKRYQQRVADADPGAGRLLARECAECHKWDENGAGSIGPNLFGVLGRRIAEIEDHSYSACLQTFRGPDEIWGFWSYQLFDDFLNNPEAFLADCGVEHPQVRNQSERIALAAFFGQQSNDPYIAD